MKYEAENKRKKKNPSLEIDKCSQEIQHVL